MIQANDLRVDNLLIKNGEVVKIVEIGIKHEGDTGYYLRCEGDRCRYWLDQFKPIELTEEILLKCGFIENEFSYIYEDETRVSIYVNDDFFFCQIDDIVIKDIYYLHQLQNLYKCLCGKELTNEALEINL